MYNAQFQQPSYGPPPQRPQQQPHNVNNAMSSAAAAMGNENKALPSPLTTSSLDSTSSPTHPPGSPRPYPSTRRSYNHQQQHQQPYDTPVPSFVEPSTSTSTIAAPETSRSMRTKEMAYYDQPDQWTTQAPASYNKPPPQQQAPPPDTGVADEIQQRNMQHLFEKKRRRRESHNAVERRRRDNINDRITDLATMLPDRDASKMNKGAILKESVDHIRFLHNKLSEYQQHIQELESLLTVYRVQRPGDPQQQQLLRHHPHHQHQHQHQHQQAVAAGMIAQGHSLDLADMSPHLGGPRDPFRHDG